MAGPREYPSCPQCRRNFSRRASRQGVAERLLSLLYIYPFRCQLCACRFRAVQWGARFERYTPDRREYVRLPIQVPATFSGERVQGQGTVVNMSMRGCGLQTATRPNAGEVLRLRLEGLNGHPQVTIDAAVVRSFTGQEVGLEILRLQEGEKEKLRRIAEAFRASPADR